jgi:serine/threonine-protein phosphatase 2A regulatory subunit B''
MAAAPSWLDQLAAFNRAHTTAASDGGAAAASRTEEDDEREIAAQVEQLLAADPAAASRRRPRAGAADWGAGEPMRRIPTFWVKKDTARSSLQAKLSRRAMAIFIERQSEELLAPEALRALLDWPMHRVNYDQFCDMGRKLGPQCAAEYFRAATFLHFERDRGGRISVAAFVGFVVRREELLRCRLHLSCYSSDLSGFITMVDLTHYVTDVVQSLPQLDHIDGFDEMFLPFYTLTAVSKFFFFLDPMHRGKVRIRELACSAELSELEELRQYQYSSDAPFVAPWEGGNWFSPHFAMQFYRYYLMLDADRNGA